MWGGKTPLNSNSYDDLQHLVVDTSLFSATFQSALISVLSSSLGDFDSHINGTLIHSDNFQALNLLQARYREQVKCIYIDPPYNTESNPIIYKNNYQHSSWLCLMQSRLEISKFFELPNLGVHCLAIDKAEQDKLSLLLHEEFHNKEIETVSVIHNPAGTNSKNFSVSGEYTLFVFNDAIEMIAKENRQGNPDIRDLMNTAKGAAGNHLRQTGRTCFYPILVKNNQVIGFGDVCEDDFHPTRNIIKNDGIIEIYPIDNDGVERKWVLGRNTVEDHLDELRVKNNAKTGLFRIERHKTRINFKTVWTDTKYSAKKYGTELLGNILPITRKMERIYPKSIHLVEDCILASLGNNKTSLILDYFAGSGTTAHAVINLNREDKGNRQYILVEQGEYFDTVLKPRVQKVIYSKAWKDGKPVAEDGAENLQGVPQIVKVLKLESYEDTLNNLELRRSGLFDHLPENAQQDYLLNYMLNLESRGSLLNVSHFEKPFDYGLNISTNSAGAYDWQKVDLVETFNYLIGANIISVDDKRDEQGFVAIECRLPNQSADEKTLIFWRDCERVGYDGLQKQFDRMGINPADSEYSQVYVNGDHTLETVWDGEQSGSLKIVSIEDAFLSLMFEGDA